MPVVVQWVLWTSGMILALGTIWAKAFLPVWRFARRAEDMLPLLNDLTLEFKDTPRAFAVLEQIAAQFRNNAGSSLRDVVDRLDKAAIANAATIGAVQIVVLELLNKVTLSEAAATAVARNLEVAQDAVDAVASDLADSHKRAADVPPSHPAGSAADAALRLSDDDH